MRPNSCLERLPLGPPSWAEKPSRQPVPGTASWGPGTDGASELRSDGKLKHAPTHETQAPRMAKLQGRASLALDGRRPVLRVHFGEFPTHFVGLRLHALDLNQPALADSRAIGRRLLPCPRMVYQLGPEWEDPALGWFRRMDPATALHQEVTVRPPRDAQPQAIPRTIHIFTFEGGRTQPHKPDR